MAADKFAWECHVLIKSGNAMTLEQFMTDNKVNPNVKFRHESLLALAIDCESPEIVKLLLRLGASPNIKSYVRPRTEPPLITATRNNCIEIVKILLLNGANLHLCGFNGYNAVFQAVVTSSADILKLFLEVSPAEISKHSSRNCPLLTALKYSDRFLGKRNCLLTLIRHCFTCECAREEFVRIPSMLAKNQDKTLPSALFKVLATSSEQVLFKEPLNLQNVLRRFIRKHLFLVACGKKLSFVTAVHSLPLPISLKDVILYKNVINFNVTLIPPANPDDKTVSYLLDLS